MSAFSENLKDAARRCPRPLIPLAAAYLAGLFFGYRAGSAALAATLFGAAACAVAEVKRSEYRVLARLLGIGWAAGYAWGAADLAARRRELGELLNAKSGPFVCRVGAPVRFQSTGRVKGVRYFFRGESFMARDGSARARRIPVEVSWYGVHPAAGGRAPEPGEVWSFRATLRPAEDRNGLPALEVNTRRQAAGPAGPDALPSSTWLERADALRRAAVKRVSLGIEDWGPIPRLNQAILLGARGEIPKEMRRVFAESGTIHIFAISGMHIVLVASILLLAVSVLGVSRRYWVFLLAPLLIFYTLLTGARPSAIRACLMSVLFFAAPLFGRRPDGISVLAGTALIVHLFRPALLFDAGCRLSFAVMTGLVLFYAPFFDAIGRRFRLEGLQERARLLAAAGSPRRARLLRWLEAALRFEAGGLAVTCAAWLSSVPLTAAYFGRFTPGGLLANLVIAPSSFFVVTGGCLGMAASLAGAFPASCFNHAAGLFTLVMIKTAEWTAALPFGTFRVRRWPAWAVALWFAGLLVWAVRLRAQARRDIESLDV